MFKFLIDFIYKLFKKKSKKEKTLWDGSGRIHETFDARPHPDNPSDDHDLYLCKNCETFIEEHALGRCYEKPHGKWKPVSNHWKNYVKTNVLLEGKKEFNIEKDVYYKFNEQIKWRERRYGIPLPDLQKIKAARAIAHEEYPTEKYWGKRGHCIRERFRREILKSVDFDYKIK